MRHHIASRLIEVDGGRATARSYFAVYTDHRLDHAGTYDDKLVRSGEGWRFTHRRVRIDWQSPTSLFRRMPTR